MTLGPVSAPSLNGPTSRGAGSVIISVPACGVRMLSRMRPCLARSRYHHASALVRRPSRGRELGPLQVAPMPGRLLHCAACPPTHGMGAKSERTDECENHLQTSANVSLSWVNCALTGSHQIITLAQRPPPLAARRCAVVHAQPLDGLAHRDSFLVPSIPTAPTAA
jgi:hypothetical protein